MWENIFVDNNEWVNYTLQHYISFGIFTLFGFIFIRHAYKHWNVDQQWKNLFYFCLFLWFVQYLKVFIRWQLGIFNPEIDCPLELCNMLPIFMTIMAYLRSRQLWAIFFLWIFVGTFQANLTPTLRDAFPHYEYLRYWIIHMGLPIAALYCVINFGFRLKFKDLFKSWIALNVVAWTMFVINHFLGSNYMYMQGKPPGKTLYNAMMDYPYYLIQIQFVLWLLMLVVYAPFWILKRKAASKVSS